MSPMRRHRVVCSLFPVLFPAAFVVSSLAEADGSAEPVRALEPHEPERARLHRVLFCRLEPSLTLRLLCELPPRCKARSLSLGQALDGPASSGARQPESRPRDFAESPAFAIAVQASARSPASIAAATAASLADSDSADGFELVDRRKAEGLLCARLRAIGCCAEFGRDSGKG